MTIFQIAGLHFLLNDAQDRLWTKAALMRECRLACVFFLAANLVQVSKMQLGGGKDLFVQLHKTALEQFRCMRYVSSA